MTDHAIRRYLELATTPDPEVRRDGLADVVADAVEYLDPHAPEAIIGRDGLEAFLTMFASRVGHVRFEADGDTEVFHHGFRQRWQLVVRESGERFSAGSFVGTTAPDGRVRLIMGFIDVEPG